MRCGMLLVLRSPRTPFVAPTGRCPIIRPSFGGKSLTSESAEALLVTESDEWIGLSRAAGQKEAGG
jgi:hypothetical protein